MKKYLTLSALSIAFLAGSANANMVDLTTAGSSGAINGAQFFQYTADLPTGTGVFGPFLRVQKNEIESGYNTNGALQFDTKSGPWTHAIKLGDIPLINGYRQFSLDINESTSGTNPLLSLDQVQLFVTSNASLTGYNPTSGTFPTGATKIYDTDTPSGSPTSNNWVKLDYTLSGSGSGRADMLMYVPDSYFMAGGATTSSYVVMYSKFGTVFGSDNGLYASAGFEEWSINNISTTSVPIPPQSVPVPTAAWLLGSGLIGMVGIGRRRVTAISA